VILSISLHDPSQNIKQVLLIATVLSFSFVFFPTSLTFCAGLIIGLIVDKVGPRRPVLAGLICVTVSIFVLGLGK
jgi:MFS family permease